jgi:site-specific DNA-methyltransferase (adenine-specific)
MKLLLGDCLDKLKELDDNSVDSIVTDPPYGLAFMGKHWDYDVPSQQIWEECMRVLKPGGHLLSFAGSRTYHRMAVRIEDAGFEIRDQIMWVYGSGFPKSRNIGKDIEKIKVGGIKNLKQVGTKQGIKVETGTSGYSYSKEYVAGKSMGGKQISGDIPVYEITNEWGGWGTALKPAHEPIVMARKPLSEKTVGNNVLEWGTGGINIDECRIGTDEELGRFQVDGNGPLSPKHGFNNNSMSKGDKFIEGNPNGRFPANILFDEEAGKLLDEQTGVLTSGFMKAGTTRKMSESNVNTYGHYDSDTSYRDTYGDSGGASRFFYCPKTSKSDRSEGNNHPTVKPTDLMAYLIRLVTPKGGIVLDPFMGSGSTGKAAVREEMEFIGIERENEYFEIAKSRIEYEINKPTSKPSKTKKAEVEPEVVNKFFSF